ncbi:hypothetical protein C0992_012134, partial [Termitomyces sp. T32_za158]
KQLKEQLEVRDLKAQGLASATPAIVRPMEEPSSSNDDPTVEQALGVADSSPRTTGLEDAWLHEHIRRGYSQDKFYVEILNKPTEHPRFVIEQKLIYMMSPAGVKPIILLGTLDIRRRLITRINCIGGPKWPEKQTSSVQH